MSLSVELTLEQEAKLRGQASAAGVEPAEYMTRLLDGAPGVHKGLLPGESLLDACKRLGYAGSFKGEPRSDARAWSEIEGFEFE